MLKVRMIDDLLVFLFFFILVTTAVNCGSNEVSAPCSPDISCQPSCNHRAGISCPRDCDLTSCVCQDGYIRDDNLQCIEESQCDSSM